MRSMHLSACSTGCVRTAAALKLAPGVRCASKRHTAWRRRTHASAAASVPAAAELALEVTQPLPWDGEWRDTFLKHYWGKRPVLIRQAFPQSWRSPTDSDELAGLACEEDVDARVISQVDDGEGETSWKLQSGPFAETFFQDVQPEKWQLLVRGVNRRIPAVADLLARFDMVPTWLVDDVMVSFALPGGGVGPHTDSFDVFLLQGEGQKTWSVMSETRISPDDDSAHVAGSPVRVLSDAVWRPDHSWTLDPGDMLYVPPHCPHGGVQVGAGQTLSVGFLAPSYEELLSSFAADAIVRRKGRRHYERDLTHGDNGPGAISARTVREVRGAITEALEMDDVEFAAWLGRHLSTPHEDYTLGPDEAWSEAAVRERLEAGEPLCRNEGTRTHYTQLDGKVSLFVDGAERRAGQLSNLPHAEFIKRLCDSASPMTLPAEGMGGREWELLLELLNDGSLYFVSERADVPEEYQRFVRDEDSSDDDSDAEGGA